MINIDNCADYAIISLYVIRLNEFSHSTLSRYLETIVRLLYDINYSKSVVIIIKGNYINILSVLL